MADVTGPISTLPGAAHEVPEGAMCDEHPDRPAVVRIQGETDSFGSEMYDCCDECAAGMRAELRAPDIGRCDWCKADDVPRRPQRDYEEGMHGRVYSVCEPCRKKYEKQLDQEWASYDSYDHYDDRCPTCKGKGTVNPLTAPKDFFCVGTTECPSCDGTGYY